MTIRLGDFDQMAQTADESNDASFMAQALEYGRRGMGVTSPNPSVGALVVRGNVIVGRGVTAEGGRPHGETLALADAGEAARGATLYVTLEPCSHVGHTGPCADAIIVAGIARVVCAIQDPDPRVAGNGFARLRAAGIAVDVGLMGAAARRSHLGHILRVTQARPMLTLKLAQTQDGFAGLDGARLQISGKIANAYTHMQRARHDAVMVGIGTVLADNPILNVRLPGLLDRKPLRVILDSHLRLPLDSAIVESAQDYATLVICGGHASSEATNALVASGVEVMRAKMTNDPMIDLDYALQGLARRGLARVFCEGGPHLAAGFIEHGLVDEFVLLTAPEALAPPSIDALAALTVTGRQKIEHEFTLLETLHLGADLCQIYSRVGG